MTTREELEQEVEWRKCSDPDTGCQYFLENYWYIKSPLGPTLFALRPGQVEALSVWVARENAICLKARQIGWTTLAAGYLFWLVYFGGSRECIALSKTQSDAKRYISMARYGYKRLPEWVRSRGPKLVKGQDNQLQLGFDNDSLILSLPSRDDPARGYTGYCVIVDEWASLNNPAEAWAAVEPAADVGGQIIGFSTAKGYGDWFHRFWNAAVNGANDFTPLFFAWSTALERDEEWYAEKVKNMEPWQLRQEYPSTADEAFVASGDSVFDYDMLMERVQVLEPVHEGNIYMGTDSPQFVKEHDGPLAIWGLPRHEAAYVIGADSASGSPEGDYSTAHVIDVETGRVVARFKDRLPIEDFAETLGRLGTWYNTALLAPERNTHGMALVQRLAHVIDYPNLYMQRRMNVSQSVTRNVGWQTTQDTKHLMVTELGAALRQGKILIHCGDTLSELIAYKRHIGKSGSERYSGSPHDDLVMSLGIAVCVAREQIVYEEVMVPEQEIVEGTLAYWEMLLDEAGMRRGETGAYTAGWTNRPKAKTI